MTPPKALTPQVNDVENGVHAFVKARAKSEAAHQLAAGQRVRERGKLGVEVQQRAHELPAIYGHAINHRHAGKIFPCVLNIYSPAVYRHILPKGHGAVAEDDGVIGSRLEGEGHEAAAALGAVVGAEGEGVARGGGEDRGEEDRALRGSADEARLYRWSA